MTMLEMKIEAKNKVMSHERPVTCAIYNSLYNQVSRASMLVLAIFNLKSVFDLSSIFPG